ncbi:hypothetical protein [Micromonospora purpureochromogenes]|uniref:Uncharacterized protein n=1 Tax=Micromonospora purpureochromogenes TaxID=47872 RepID=A0ABX2RKD1_9ACTN|nr:hypothetical protein [Micromonospora purpureochromogenes]NYF56970.1 hypothetical protein [Micromonospora purpureochromogenes]
MPARFWNFGPTGNLVWRHFPERREQVAELVARSLEDGLDDDSPELPEQFEYMIHVVGPLVLDRIGVRPVEPDLLHRFCQFCRDMLAYSGPDPDVWEVEHNLYHYVVESIDGPRPVEVLLRADPELVAAVRARFPGSWAEPVG